MQLAHHIGLTVKDLDRTIDFYHDTLGLEFALAPTDWMDDEHMAEALGVDPPAKIRLVAFWVSGQTIVECLEYASPPSERERALTQNHIGASHLGIQVDDIDTKVAELRAKGVPFNSVVHDIEEGPFGGWRWVYFRDPDGHTLEYVEIRWQNDDLRARDIETYLAARSG